MKIDSITIHHSLTKDSDTVSWGAIRGYHKSMGWRDIGYHFGIELLRGQHEILVGRMLNENGAHCPQGGMNKKSIGICFIGNFDNEPPPKEMWNLGIRLVSSLCSLFEIPSHRVFGHRAFNPKKTCPGKMFHMRSFIQELEIKTVKEINKLRSGGY